MSNSFGSQGTVQVFTEDSTSGTLVPNKSISGAELVMDGALATIIVSSGGNTYSAEAIPGSSATAALWRAQKLDSSGNVTWADGNANFDNTPGAAGASL